MEFLDDWVNHCDKPIPAHAQRTLNALKNSLENIDHSLTKTLSFLPQPAKHGSENLKLDFY